MKTRPDATTIQTIKHAAQKLTGSVRREFQAAVTLDHCHGSSRFARKLFGWNSLPNSMDIDGHLHIVQDRSNRRKSRVRKVIRVD